MKFIASALLLLFCLHGAISNPITINEPDPYPKHQIRWEGTIRCNGKPINAWVELWESDTHGKYAEVNNDDFLAKGYFPYGNYSLIGDEHELDGFEPYLRIEIDCQTWTGERQKCDPAIKITDHKRVGSYLHSGTKHFTEDFEMCEVPTTSSG